MARPSSARWTRCLAFPLVVGLATACQPADQAEDPAQEMSDTVPTEDTMESMESMESMQTMPDTTAEGLWAHLVAEDYAANWNRWPGTTELYPGGDPHGMLRTTYVNDVAQGAVSNRTDPLPPGP